MSDMGYFACLGVATASAITAILSARSIIQSDRASGAAITLAVSSCIGFLCTLPFGNTREMPRLPMVGEAVSGSVVLAAILCCLCQIRQQNSAIPNER